LMFNLKLIKLIEKEANMSLNLLEDIRSVSELKRYTREILEQVRKTRRPVMLTVNGKPDAVLIDAKSYEKQMKALNLARLLAEGEEDISAGRVRPARSFLREFKNAHKIRG
jgi:prevent-host-death family protein